MHLLNPRNDLRNHSPDGFNWGYGGSGPAQLALALCCDALGDDEAALGIYQWLKFRWVGAIQGDTWQITAADLLVVIKQLQIEKTQTMPHDSD